MAIAQWSLDHMTDEDVGFVRDLPGALRIHTPGAPPLTLVHATPWSIEDVVLREDVAVEVRRVEFDGEAAALAMRASGAPLSEQMLRAIVSGGPWEVAAIK